MEGRWCFSETTFSASSLSRRPQTVQALFVSRPIRFALFSYEVLTTPLDANHTRCNPVHRIWPIYPTPKVTLVLKKLNISRREIFNLECSLRPDEHGSSQCWAGMPGQLVYPRVFSTVMTSTCAECENFPSRVSNPHAFYGVKIQLS